MFGIFLASTLSPSMLQPNYQSETTFGQVLRSPALNVFNAAFMGMGMIRISAMFSSCKG